MKLIEHEEFTEVNMDQEPMALGDVYSRRAVWETGDPETPYFMATVVGYTEGHYVDRDGSSIEQIDPSENFEHMMCIDSLDFDKDDYRDGELLTQFYEMQTVELLYFTDLDDPGGSEVVCDYEYEDIGETWRRSLEDSNEFCRGHVASFNFELAFNANELQLKEWRRA